MWQRLLTARNVQTAVLCLTLRCSVVFLAGVMCSLQVGNSIADPQVQPAFQSSLTEQSLKHYLHTGNGGRYRMVRYIAAFQDLNGDGKPEAIVYFTSQEWCGTSGCHVLVLTQNGRSWTIVAEISAARLPIRVLTGLYKGWRSLGVWVEGGGVQPPGYEAELRFNGKTYPSNPTIPPARRLEGNASGGVLISRESM
jgi:hypothetical protein